MRKMNFGRSVKITTLVDNDVWMQGLASSWGLSLYVEIDSGEERHRILMDTSGSSDVLFKNVSKLEVDLSDVEAVFVSHWHLDHCGCLSHVLPLVRQRAHVYVPSMNPSGIKTIKDAEGIPVVCSDPVSLMGGVMSTGEMIGGASEHSLVINISDKGLVVLAGCAHPGIVNIVKRAQQVSGVSELYAVIGGFHISSKREGTNVAEFLRELGAQLVSPCHCTGVDAKQAITDIMRDNFGKNGSGKAWAIN
ncbi:MAG TPA: MBL fold metallo-hydrolase [Candidatus Bathyarchaeota archaeon]|nr:MBL fold metallo-hydrolase [Candidatus Bathyarchaeota archaeon]